MDVKKRSKNITNQKLKMSPFKGFLSIILGSQYRKITNTWSDDWLFDEDGKHGWKDTGNYCDDKGCTEDNPVTTGDLNKYHGPYYAHGGDGNKPLYYLSQQFLCQYPSNVSVSFKYAECSADGSDYYKFYFDDVEVDEEKGNTPTVSLNDATLNDICDKGWKYKSKTFANIGSVQSNELFEPKWEFSMNAYDYFVLYDIQIDCDGTPYPTSMPMPSRKLLDSSDSTDFQIPTKHPSVNPTSKPSVKPTTSPISAPTKHPSINPTAAPTDIPSKTPTIAPSTAPSNYPSSNPTGMPTEIPSKGPTVSPTKLPTESPSSYVCLCKFIIAVRYKHN